MRRRIIRRIIQDPFTGRNIVIEEIENVPVRQPTQVASLFDFGLGPLAGFMNPFEMNFRSNLSDNLLEQILRASMQDRGRSGTPPASEQAINNLPEVEVTEKLCKLNEKDGSLEYPRCTICCDDLKEKATMLPCGHMFNKECIGEWLHQHNQCPVCRYELPTDDAEYEVQRKLRERANSSDSQNSTASTSSSLSAHNEINENMQQ